MAEPSELIIPPNQFGDFLKNNSSVSGAVYEANRDQFEEAIRTRKIIMKQQPDISQITIGKKVVSTTYTYSWEWIGDSK